MTPEEKQQILKELGGIPEETYDALVKELLETLKQQVEDLRLLLKNKDMTALGELAHSVKGSAGNFRVREVHQAAESLEKGAKNNEDETTLGNKISELDACLQKFIDNF